jgi:hypothetical protein
VDDRARQVDVEFNHLRGTLLALIASWGLARDPGGALREEGMKSTVKHITYETQRVVTELLTRADG